MTCEVCVHTLLFTAEAPGSVAMHSRISSSAMSLRAHHVLAGKKKASSSSSVAGESGEDIVEGQLQEAGEDSSKKDPRPEASGPGNQKHTEGQQLQEAGKAGKKQRAADWFREWWLNEVKEAQDAARDLPNMQDEWWNEPCGLGNITWRQHRDWCISIAQQTKVSHCHCSPAGFTLRTDSAAAAGTATADACPPSSTARTDSVAAAGTVASPQCLTARS